MDLLERDRELEILGDGLAEARRGRGQLMVIEGVAGSGKSSLLTTLKRIAAGVELRVLSARGGKLERALAFGVVRQLFEAPLANAGPVERQRRLAGAAALAAPVVTTSSPEMGDRPAWSFAVLHAIYWLAANFAVERPLLVAVDDLHWVDHSSLLALDFLGRRIADLPIALAVALRPHEPGAPADVIACAAMRRRRRCSDHSDGSRSLGSCGSGIHRPMTPSVSRASRPRRAIRSICGSCSARCHPAVMPRRTSL